jgi:non-SMC mitotic condensation complex subunit 1
VYNNITTNITLHQLQEADAMEDEMGMAAADDADHERIVNHVIEREIVFNNLLGKFHPFIAFIVANENQKSNKSVAKSVAVGGQKDGADGPFSAPIIRETSLLALSRYMCVSNALCEMYLPLLFTVLEREPEAVNRTTIMIALADLAFRFPNAVEPWVNRMFARLSDENTYVRYNTLMVLTHLILNDMVKVKGQVSHVVICLTDPDDRIRELSTLFFVKLSERSNNPIYNLLGDIIATLSRDVPASTANSSSLTAAVKSEEGASGSERGKEGEVAQGEGRKEGEVKGQEEEDGTGPMDVDEDGDISKQISSTASSAGDTVTDTGRGDKMVMATEDDNEVVAVAVVDIDESSLPSKVLSQKEFQNTLHFLLSFVKKDKQADLLFERLIIRLSLAQTVRQRRNIAYCISELTVSQKGLKKLIDSFKTLREALHDSQVFDCIRSTVSKAKRAFSFRSGGAAGVVGGGEEDGTGVVLPPVTAAGEGKGVVEELENLLKEFGVVKSSSAGGEEGEEREDRGENEGGEEEGEGVRTVSKSVRSKGKGGQGGVGRGKSDGGVKKGRAVAKKGRRRGDSSDEESEEEEEEEEELPKRAVPIKKPNQNRKQNKSKKVQSDSESEEEDELDFE